MSVDRDFEARRRLALDRDFLQHQRRLALMREMGRANRAEMRVYWFWAFAITLSSTAIVMALVF